MFIKINGDTYSTYLIQMIYKDDLTLVYNMSNGTVLKEEFDNSEDLDAKYNSILGGE